MRVTVLGAGDMGTAITTPIVQNGHDVRLWGTRYDDPIIQTLRDGGPHPRLKTPAPTGLNLYQSDQLADAMDGADVLLLAVISSGIDPILNQALTIRPDHPPVVSLTKGFIVEADGKIGLISEHIARRTGSPTLVVGGPAKANEIALASPTVSLLGGTDPAVLTKIGRALASPTYRLELTNDRIGVEVAAAMKNAYAIAVGIALGAELQTERPHQNLRAAIFAASVLELTRLVVALGGEAETVQGLAGVGDLLVTITAGRNRLLGELIGRGQPADEALRTLSASGLTIEGHAAIGYGLALARQTHDLAADSRYPILAALNRILTEQAPAVETIWAAIAS